MASVLENEIKQFWNLSRRLRIGTATEEDLDDMELIARNTSSSVIRRDYARLVVRECASSA